METKTSEFDLFNLQNEEVHKTMEAYMSEIKTLKQNVADQEVSVSNKITDIEKLSHDLKDKNEKIESLESDLEIKSKEIQTMNEEVMSKYKIIEELQNQVDSLENSNGVETELSSTIEKLKSEILDLKKQCEDQMAETNSKASALEKLQTVFDVCEEQSNSTQEEVKVKEKNISRLEKEIELLNSEKTTDNETVKLNLQLEEMSITLTSLQQMKETYEEKIKTLENE